MCQQCGKEEHFPADCVITMPAPTPHLYTAPFSGSRAAQYGTGAHPAQYSTGALVAHLWMESVLWASGGFNRSATTANGGMLSPYESFYGSRPPMPTLPFCKPAYHRLPRHGKLDRQVRLCYFLNFGYNHGSDCIKIMDAETGRIVHSRDVTWHQPREPLISPAPTVESEVPQSPPGAATPEYIYIQPAPAATTAPAAAPVPASDNAAPAPLRNPTEPIRDRVVRELRHEGDVRMPGRTRGETRAMRESPRSMGLMPHAALAQGIATHEAFDEAFHEHELPPPDADLPTAPASDVPTPSTVARGGLIGARHGMA